MTNETPAWQPEEDFPAQERPPFGNTKDGKGKAGKQDGYPGNTGKRKAPPSGASGAQRRAISRKAGTPPSIQARRRATSKRATGR